MTVFQLLFKNLIFKSLREKSPLKYRGFHQSYTSFCSQEYRENSPLSLSDLMERTEDSLDTSCNGDEFEESSRPSQLRFLFSTGFFQLYRNWRGLFWLAKHADREGEDDVPNDQMVMIIDRESTE